jgi:hypothetical protein
LPALPITEPLSHIRSARPATDDLHARKIILDPPVNESRSDFYKSYLDDDMPFVAKCGRNIRTIDRALYTFGQFLKIVQPYAGIPNQLP